MGQPDTAKERELAAALADAIRHGGDIEEALDAGANPYVNPTGITTIVRHREYIPETPLEWAALRGRADLLPRFLEMPGELAEGRPEKLLGMAALGCSMEALEILVEALGDPLDYSHAFAYCIYRGFTQGALYLYDRGALDMCEGWIATSSKFEHFLLRYSHFNGPPTFEASEDFFAYLFSLVRLDAVLNARKVPLSNIEERCCTLAALAKRGMLTAELYQQYAERAILFDRCDLLPFLDSISGFDAIETFSAYPWGKKRSWVIPGMSEDKVDFVSRIMGPEYRFTISSRFLMGKSSVKALVAHSDAEHVLHPDLLVRYLIHTRLTSELYEVADWGFITQENIDEHLAFAQQCENTEAVALLLDYRNSHSGGKDPFEDVSAASL